VTGSRSIARRVATGFGWAIVVAGALLALLIAGPLVVGDHPHTDLTGSMEPAISPGDVVIDEQISPWEAEVGDIVTFRDPKDESKLLTHRVVRTQEHWQVPATGEIARVAYTVPWVGHIAVFARTRLGWGLLIGIPLLLILLEELVRIWRPRQRPDEGGSTHGTA
jgi:signal peptidase